MLRNQAWWNVTTLAPSLLIGTLTVAIVILDFWRSFKLQKRVWRSFDCGAMTTLAINVSVIVDGVRLGHEQLLFVGRGVRLSSVLPQVSSIH